MTSSPKTVSVCMLTYNHEPFIADAIEGVLMQEADFGIELVIGEDCSTDKTRTLCEAYAAKFPDKINLLPTSKNLGIQKNFLRTFSACLGAEYVALCDGDDRWTDKNKLSVQVEFLRQNPYFTAHAHNVLYRDLRDMTERTFGESVDRPCTASELVHGWPFHGISLLVKSDLLRMLPLSGLPHFISCDRFLNMWIACKGALYYEGTRNMAIYNRHGQGASGSSNYAEIRHQDLSMLEFLKPYFSDREIYRQARVNAIEYFVYDSVEANRKRTLRIISLALEYIKLTSLKKRRNVYYLLLMLFGSPFLGLYQRFSKKVLH